MKKTDILEQHPPKMENVLLILHALQDNHPRHYLSKNDLTHAARYLDTSLSSIYGIASYYSMYSLRPRGQHIIRICRSPVCDLTGMNDLRIVLCDLLKIDAGETTPDGRFSLEVSECLGLCDSAPAMMIDAVAYGNLTPKKVKDIVAQYRKKGRRPRRPQG